MQDFALITEGVTDHAIIKNILIGYFKTQREPDINREHPSPQAEKKFGGWTLVLDYLRSGKYKQALQANRYLIIQIDTDISEEKGFDVPKQNDSGPIEDETFIKNVIDRLVAEIPHQDWIDYGDRFIFAIGFHQLECWVLPLWYFDAKGKQTANCTTRLGACQNLRQDLTAKKLPWISSESKDYWSYDHSSRGFRKSSGLELGLNNVGLRIFLGTLASKSIILPPIAE